MDSVSFMKSQEDAAYGEFLISAICEPLGLETVQQLKRAIYKHTDCGAWVEFDSEGIMVGTIVEGSDADYHERIDLSGIDCDESGEKILNERFWAAIQNCEDFAEENFNNGDEFCEEGTA